MSLKLSEGALEVIMNGGDYKSPVMQVLGSKKLASANSTDRYRLLISDGKHHNSFAMVATQLNDLIANGELPEFTVVRINRFITSIVNSTSDKERRVMVILELDILKKGNEVGIRIGNPTNFEGSTVTTGTTGGNSNSNANAMNNSANMNSNTKERPAPPARAAPTYTNNQIKTSPSLQNATIHPISSLNPYQNKWCIKARVTNKQGPRTYTNARGDGQLFSVTFTDESGDIKCTGFNSAVDKFANMLEVNKVYLVSNCYIKPANKKFTQADYEMTFHDDSNIELCPDDESLPNVVFNFTPISKISELDVDRIVDVIGIAKSASEVQNLIARTTGKELKKREVNLVDQSGVGVTLTLWGQEAEDFDCTREPVVACKGAKVSEFMGGKSLGTLMNSIIQIDPDIPDAHKLRGWYDNGGNSVTINSISARSGGSSGGGTGNWVHLGDVASQGLGLNDKPDYFSCVVNVLLVKHENCYYKACPGNDCKKKIIDMNNGTYRCEKCGRDYDHFMYRLLLSVQVSDYTGSSWVTLFNEEAQKLLGADAQTIGELLESKDEGYKEYFNSINFKKFQMKFRVKMENYNDEKRLKTTVVSVDPVDSNAYAKRLLEEFKLKAGVSTGN